MQSNRSETEYIVQDVIEAADQVRVYRFLHGLVPLAFEPGQFVVARLPEAPDQRASLTLASAPADPNGFELMVKRTGEFGAHFYDRVDIGSSVLLTQPTGPFYPDDGDTPLCYVGHDYTVPAVRSLLLHYRGLGKRRPVVLLHEVADPSRVVFAEDFAQAAETGFRWVTLPPGGLTTEAVREHLDDLASYRFFVQAEGAECKRMAATLSELGVDKGRLLKERWS